VVLSCQTAKQFERATDLDIMHFTCHYLYKMLCARALFFSVRVLARHTLWQVLVAGWHVRLANVYGFCVGINLYLKN